MLLMLSVNLCFASTLSASKEFQILSVNGKKIEKPFFSTAKAVDLKQGIQKVSIVYNTLVRNDEGSELAKVSSQTFLVTLKVKKNKKYRLLANIDIDSLNTARKFARHPDIKVETSNGKPADFSVTLSKYKDYGFLGNIFKKDKALRISTPSPQATAKPTKSQDKK